MNFSQIWKPIAIIFIALGVVIAFGYASIYGFGTMQKDTAGFRGGVEKKERVEADGGYRVAQHDYFYNLCSDIQTKQDNIETLKGTGNKDAVTGNRLELNKLVNRYNADAANNYTKGQFKADELPYHIDSNKEVNSCGTAK